jgi:hypothetical protein
MKKDNEKKENKNKIPLGVKLIIILYSLGVILYILAALISTLKPDLLNNVPNFDLQKFGNNIFYIFAGIMITLAVIFSIIVYGLIKRKNWARLTAIIISIIFVVGGILSILENNLISIINLVVNFIIVIYLLFKKSVKNTFNPSVEKDSQ